MTRDTVLFVDDEEHLRIAAGQTFDLAEVSFRLTDNAEAALTLIEDGFDGILVTDIRMPGMDGVALMKSALQIDPDLPVILITGHGDVELAVTCIKDGAYDFLEKPCEPARLVACVKRALEKRRLTLENRELKAQVASSNVVQARLIGRSAAMQSVRASVAAVAQTDADVLITGDTGTGKEVAARAIHAASAQADGPFVLINCAALPDSLIESELFGHEAGAFPGAMRARYGKFEHARGGVLCLDEIDLLPMPLQAKLLDVLHNREVTRLGSNDAIPLDMRVIALAKSNLETAVAEGVFRSDLLYRLNLLTLHMPPLAERRDDIPGLFTMLAQDAATRRGRPIPVIPPQLVSTLSTREWPGNVRELRNAAERFVLDLPPGLQADVDEGVSLADRMAAHEKALISAAIVAHGGRLKDAYESLGLSRKTLYDKMQKHGLNRDDLAPKD